MILGEKNKWNMGYSFPCPDVLGNLTLERAWKNHSYAWTLEVSIMACRKHWWCRWEMCSSTFCEIFFEGRKVAFCYNLYNEVDVRNYCCIEWLRCQQKLRKRRISKLRVGVPSLPRSSIENFSVYSLQLYKSRLLHMIESVTCYLFQYIALQ